MCWGPAQTNTRKKMVLHITLMHTQRFYVQSVCYEHNNVNRIEPNFHFLFLLRVKWKILKFSRYRCTIIK